MFHSDINTKKLVHNRLSKEERKGEREKKEEEKDTSHSEPNIEEKLAQICKSGKTIVLVSIHSTTFCLY